MTKACVLTATALIMASSASAQVLGTFSWQTQPYCNRIILTVVQVGAIYQLNGADDLCGAGAAPVTGTAVATGPSVALGMTVTLPTGPAAKITASLALPNMSGTWSDAEGRNGPFVFNGNVLGAVRPAPAGATMIVTTQLDPSIYGGTGVATTLSRSDHDHDSRYYTQGQIDGLKTPAAVTTTILGGPAPAYTFVPEGPPALAQSVTSDRAGHWLVSKMFAGNTSCSGGGEALLFLIVDGVAVRASAIYRESGAPFVSTRLSGVTDIVVPAGSHTVAIAGECPGAATFSVASFFIISNTSVVVLP